MVHICVEFTPRSMGWSLLMYKWVVRERQRDWQESEGKKRQIEVTAGLTPLQSRCQGTGSQWSLKESIPLSHCSGEEWIQSVVYHISESLESLCMDFSGFCSLVFQPWIFDLCQSIIDLFVAQTRASSRTARSWHFKCCGGDWWTECAALRWTDTVWQYLLLDLLLFFH